MENNVTSLLGTAQTLFLQTYRSRALWKWTIMTISKSGNDILCTLQSFAFHSKSNPKGRNFLHNSYRVLIGISLFIRLIMSLRGLKWGLVYFIYFHWLDTLNLQKTYDNLNLHQCYQVVTQLLIHRGEPFEWRPLQIGKEYVFSDTDWLRIKITGSMLNHIENVLHMWQNLTKNQVQKYKIIELKIKFKKN